MSKNNTTQKDEIVLLGDRVLIKLLDKVDYTKTSSGLIVAASVQDQVERGTVVAIGLGRATEHGNFIYPTVRPGDTVIFSSFAKTPVLHNGETMYIVTEPNIVAIIK